MYSLLLALSILVHGFGVSSAALACDIPTGVYRTVTESHYAARLTLSEDGSFFLEHRAWLAGEPAMVDVIRVEGSWQCDGSAAVFADGNSEIRADYRLPDSYPLGIYQDVEALVFDTSNDENPLLQGTVFWPAEPE